MLSNVSYAHIPTEPWTNRGQTVELLFISVELMFFAVERLFFAVDRGILKTTKLRPKLRQYKSEVETGEKRGCI